LTTAYCRFSSACEDWARLQRSRFGGMRRAPSSGDSATAFQPSAARRAPLPPGPRLRELAFGDPDAASPQRRTVSASAAARCASAAAVVASNSCCENLVFREQAAQPFDVSRCFGRGLPSRERLASPLPAARARPHLFSAAVTPLWPPA